MAMTCLVVGLAGFSSYDNQDSALIGVACGTSWQVALNWLLLQGNVVPIPGAKSASQVIDSI
jgi:aryl-alcohol dehydrogenase-like predicted oxidoreductase